MPVNAGFHEALKTVLAEIPDTRSSEYLLDFSSWFRAEYEKNQSP
jgi:hypothetical protein